MRLLVDILQFLVDDSNVLKVYNEECPAKGWVHPLSETHGHKKPHTVVGLESGFKYYSVDISLAGPGLLATCGPRLWLFEIFCPLDFDVTAEFDYFTVPRELLSRKSTNSLTSLNFCTSGSSCCRASSRRTLLRTSSL